MGLRGVILDSSPTEIQTTESALGGMMSTYIFSVQRLIGWSADGKELDGMGRRKAALALNMAVLSGNSPLRAYWGSMPHDLEGGKANVAEVHELEPPVPLFFIYSTSDIVIPAEGTELYISECVARPS